MGCSMLLVKPFHGFCEDAFLFLYMHRSMWVEIRKNLWLFSNNCCQGGPVKKGRGRPRTKKKGPGRPKKDDHAAVFSQVSWIVLK